MISSCIPKIFKVEVFLVALNTLKSSTVIYSPASTPGRILQSHPFFKALTAQNESFKAQTHF